MTRLLEPETVLRIKLVVATLAVALLLAGLVLRRIGRPQALERFRDASLAALGVVGALCWWNLFEFSAQPGRALRWVHLSDAFHYYMGPKYFRELGYTHLYECCAAAEQRLGAGQEVARRTYRDLETNGVITGGAMLGKARACEARFTPARWQVFVHDVAWFRSRMPGWETTMQDWGYNATPAWNLLGSWLAGAGPVSEGRLGMLTLLDVPCLVAMWGLVAWAFGWRAMCVGLIFWGTNLVAGSNWTGGSILRQEWLLASAAGVCLLRRGKLVAAGAAITYAASLVIFPAFLALGVAVETLAAWARERRLGLTPERRRLLAGAVLAVAVVGPLSMLESGSRAWLDFAANLRTDIQPSTNNVGLPMLLGYSGDSRLRMLQLENRARPAEDWMEARTRTLAGRMPWLLGIVGAWLALFLGVARRQPDWVVAILGLGLAALTLQLSCYYYAFLLLFALLWPRRASVGLALCAVALASHWIEGRWRDDEQFCTWFSLVVVAFVFYATAAVRAASAAEIAPTA